jgi:hypothetical protein
MTESFYQQGSTTSVDLTNHITQDDCVKALQDWFQDG